MNKRFSLSLFVSALLMTSNALNAAAVLNLPVPGASLDQPPALITVYVYHKDDLSQPIAHQDFTQDEWKGSQSGGGVSYQVDFASLDSKSLEGLWYEVEADGVLAASGWLEPIAVTGSMYVSGEVGTGVGVRFPGGGLQIAPGVTTEVDPTVAASVKDGVSWAEVTAKPAGFADNVDNVGITIEVDPTVAASVKDGVSWAEVTAKPAGFADNVDDVGLTSESDPQVGANAFNYVPKWNGSALVTGTIYDDGEDIGIGTFSPTSRLHAVDTAAGDSPAVYGEHAVYDYWGIGVQGVGLWKGVEGIVEATGDSTYYGVHGYASTTSGMGTTVGVYGYAAGGEVNWAGYFSGNGYVGGNLGIGTTTPDTRLALAGTGSSNGITLGDGEADPATIYHGSSSLNFNVPAAPYNFSFSNVGGNNRLTFGTAEYFEDCGSNCIYTNASISTTVLHIRGGADLAEPFSVTALNSPKIEPGMLLSIDPDNPGKLRVSSGAYDHTVAGIVSGANGINAGLILAQEGVANADGEIAVALTGRVYAKADASFGAIKPGDLLTTSTTPGHAMKATDRDRAAGAVIGKAMTTLDAGRDLVLVLVSLQ